MAVSISISITQNSQNIANNKSNVTVKVTASWTNGSYNAVVDANGTPQANGWLKVDGTSYNFNSTFNTGRLSSGSQVIFTKTTDIAHASDGKKTLTCSASFTTGVSSGTVTASASKTLTTIPRKSTLSVSNGTLGTSQTLTVTRQATSFTHTIAYKCGSASGTIVTKSSDTSIAWTPQLALAQQNTTGSSVSITLTITTYSGDTSVGSNSYTITCSIPASVKPTVSMKLSDDAGYLSTFGKYIQGMSKVKVSLTASGNQGSTIKSYKVVVDGRTYGSSSFTTNVISGSGVLTVEATVTDSRGRTATTSTTITVAEYAKPKFTSLSVKRSDSSGNPSSSGAYLAVRFSSVVTPIDNKNTATYTIKYKKETASTYTTKTLSSFANNYAVSNGLYVISADTASSYNVIVTVKDKLVTTTKPGYGVSVKKLFSILKGGLGFAFGKIAELSDYLDVGFKTIFRKGIYMVNNQRFFGTNPSGEYIEALNPQNENGTTVVGWGNYKAGEGDTNIYGYDLNFGVANIATPGTYIPYMRRGQSLGVTLRTAGYVANSGKDVSFFLSFTRPLIGSPTVTAASTNGFILRQGNKYTHGSASSTYVKPSSYTVTNYYSYGVLITAVFSNTTNVTNNDVIGVYWSGTLTFS